MDEKIDFIYESLISKLTPVRFIRYGKSRNLVHKCNDIFHIIDIYRGRKGTFAYEEVSGDISIISLPLLEKQIADEQAPKSAIKNPTVSFRDWSWPLGFLLPKKRDLWLDIATQESLTSTTQFITNILVEYALPQFWRFVRRKTW